MATLVCPYLPNRTAQRSHKFPTNVGPEEPDPQKTVGELVAAKTKQGERADLANLAMSEQPTRATQNGVSLATQKKLDYLFTHDPARFEAPAFFPCNANSGECIIGASKTTEGIHILASECPRVPTS